MLITCGLRMCLALRNKYKKNSLFTELRSILFYTRYQYKDRDFPRISLRIVTRHEGIGMSNFGTSQCHMLEATLMFLVIFYGD